MFKYILRLHAKQNGKDIVVENTLIEYCKRYLGHTDESLTEYKDQHWTTFEHDLFYEIVKKLRSNRGIYHKPSQLNNVVGVYHLELFTVKQYEEYILTKYDEAFIPLVDTTKLWDNDPI